MKYNEFKKYLKKHGCTFESHGSNHDVYYCPKTKKKTVLGRHGSKEIPTGTRKAILKQLGIK